MPGDVKEMAPNSAVPPSSSGFVIDVFSAGSGAPAESASMLKVKSFFMLSGFEPAGRSISFVTGMMQVTGSGSLYVFVKETGSALSEVLLSYKVTVVSFPSTSLYVDVTTTRRVPSELSVTVAVAILGFAASFCMMSFRELSLFSEMPYLYVPGFVKVMSPNEAVPPSASGFTTAFAVTPCDEVWDPSGIGTSPDADSVNVNLPVTSGAVNPEGTESVFLTEAFMVTPLTEYVFTNSTVLSGTSVALPPSASVVFILTESVPSCSSVTTNCIYRTGVLSFSTPALLPVSSTL